MFPIERQDNPWDAALFHQKIVSPGLSYYRQNHEHKNNPLWKTQDWKDFVTATYNTYEGICAYLGLKIKNSKQASIDHFFPKSLCKDHHAYLAYDWGNFRLSDIGINGNKASSTDIVDPIEEVQTGWFELSFQTFNIRVGHVVKDDELSGKILKTINTLKLNQASVVQQRRNAWYQSLGETDQVSFLKEAAPYILHEAKRQGRTHA